MSCIQQAPGDSQVKAHLMPSHLPSVCGITPLACYTTGTTMNTPVKYKHTPQNPQAHRSKLKIAGRNMCLSGSGDTILFSMPSQGPQGGFNTNGNMDTCSQEESKAIYTHHCELSRFEIPADSKKICTFLTTALGNIGYFYVWLGYCICHTSQPYICKKFD